MDLTKRDLNSCKVMAQVIHSQRQTTYGQKFIQYVCQTVKRDRFYRSQIFRMLSVLAKNSPNIQTFTLA